MPVILQDTMPGQSVYEVGVGYTYGLRRFATVLHYQQNDTDVVPGNSFLGGNAIAASVDSLITSEIMNDLNVSIVYDTLTVVRYWQSTDVRDLPTDPQKFRFLPYEKWDDSPAVSTAGSITGDCLPSFNAFSVRKRTGFPGRRYRGSCHFPGVSESDTLKDAIKSATLSQWRAVNDPALKTPAQYTDGFGHVITYIPVVWSRTDAIVNSWSVVSYAGQWAAPITSFYTNELVGTMRRRKAKV